MLLVHDRNRHASLVDTRHSIGRDWADV